MFHSIKIALFAASGLAITACVPAAAPQGSVAPPAASAPEGVTSLYKAAGMEPFWSMTIDGGTVAFRPMEGTPIVAHNASVRPNYNGWRYTTDTVSVDIDYTQCRDGMSDFWYKHSVTVLVGTTEYLGCGGGVVTPGADLAESAWEITSVNGQDAFNPLGRGPLYLRFGRDRFSAATGCNGIGGQFMSGEGWLFAPTLTSTQMACEPRLMAQEQAIGAALSGYNILRPGIEGGMILGSEGNEIALTLSGNCPECAELDGSPAMQSLALTGDWDIRQIGDDAVTSDRPYRLSFADGQMNGFAGCNRFFGEFEMADGVLNFGAIGATRMECMGAGGADERRVLDIMRAPLSYRVLSADSVILANARGGLVLYRAAD